MIDIAANTQSKIFPSNFLFSCFLVGLLCFSTGLEAQVMLIDGPKESGNGDFVYDVGGEAFGLENDTIVEATGRHRAFVSNANTGRGLAIPGWVITRVAYSGGNSAMGTDGTYGFAPGNEGSIPSGQAFANSGTIRLSSNIVVESISSGDTINLNYLLGSDSNGGTEDANATVSLVFDAGLTSEFTETFALVTRTGVDTANGFAANEVSESYVVAADFSTISVVIDIVAGDGNGERALLDEVRLDIDPSGGGSTITLIEGAKESGNGDFIYDIAGEAKGVRSTTVSEVIGRHRAFVDDANSGRGIAVPGWCIFRVQYNGGNGAFGTDGLYGFAPGNFGEIDSGQAFVNSGTIAVVSEQISEPINTGDSIELSYLLGSDTNGSTESANATVSFVFDAGLASETIETLPLVTRTGIDSANGFAANEVNESIVASSDFSTLVVVFEIVAGDGNGERALLDEVRMCLVPNVGGNTQPSRPYRISWNQSGRRFARDSRIR